MNADLKNDHSKLVSRMMLIFCLVPFVLVIGAGVKSAIAYFTSAPATVIQERAYLPPTPMPTPMPPTTAPTVEPTLAPTVMPTPIPPTATPLPARRPLPFDVRLMSCGQPACTLANQYGWYVRNDNGQLAPIYRGSDGSLMID